MRADLGGYGQATEGKGQKGKAYYQLNVLVFLIKNSSLLTTGYDSSLSFVALSLPARPQSPVGTILFKTGGTKRGHRKRDQKHDKNQNIFYLSGAHVSFFLKAKETPFKLVQNQYAFALLSLPAVAKAKSETSERRQA